MELIMLAVAAIALLTFPGAAWGLVRLRRWLQTWRGKRDYAKQQKMKESAGRAAQTALERESAEDRQRASGWSFERRTWRR